MPRETITSKTGNAEIKRQGHTATTKHGSDPNFKGRANDKPRDLKIK
jgi:hypothetical protein